MGLTLPLTYELDIDWDGDGVFESNEANRLVGYDIIRGRNKRFGVNGIEPPQIGTCVLWLDNRDQRFSPWNASSPIFPTTTSREARLRVTNSSTTYGLFRGQIREIAPVGRDEVRIELEDGWRWLDRDVQIEVNTDVTTGDAITKILEGTSWPEPSWRLGTAEQGELGETTFLAVPGGSIWEWGKSIDTGLTMIPFWWAGGQARAEIVSLVEAEAGFVYIDVDGQFVFLGRDTLYEKATDATITQSALLRDMEIAQPSDAILNRISILVRTRTKAAVAAIWTEQSGAVFIRAGESETLTATYLAATDIVTPTTPTDYTFNTAADGSGADVSANLSIAFTAYGESAELAITNNGSVAGYVTLLQIRGALLSISSDTEVLAVDTTSVNTYGPQDLRLRHDWAQNLREAIDYATWHLDFSKDPRPVPKVRIENRVIQFAHDLGAQIDLEIALHGIDENYLIGFIRHRSLTRNCQSVQTEWHMERTANAEYWRLGTAGRGELGETTKLAF